jgi:hypothetical protein
VVWKGRQQTSTLQEGRLDVVTLLFRMGRRGIGIESHEDIVWPAALASDFSVATCFDVTISFAI